MKNRLKKIAKIVLSKSFIGSIVFSSALWLYTTLNSESSAHLNVPLKITLPPNRAIENDINKEISVKVKGSGWHLLNALYFNQTNQCLIDLSGENIKDSIIELSRSDFMKNLQSMNNLEPLDIEDPKFLFVKSGKVGQYSIQVEPDVIINPREGFMVVGEIVTKPDLINITGNDKIVRKILNWRTKKLVFNDVFEPLAKVVPLSDSLKNIIKLSDNKVKIVADIQKVTEIKLLDIRIKFTGSDFPKDHKIIPSTVSITIRGGIDQISTFDRESISAIINTADIQSDSLGFLTPKISVPPNIKVLSIDPPFVRHVKRTSVNAEKRF